MRVLLGMAVLVALVWTAPVGAVLIASGDGAGNTSAPPDDPGWDSIGQLHIWTGVYMGDGWVLTADHVGAGDIVFAGTTRRAVSGSAIQLLTDEIHPADLMLFRIESDPGVPATVIASSPPSGFDEVVMVGQGRNRGEAISWDPGTGPPIDGWEYGYGRSLRWGINQVEATSQTMNDGSRITAYFSTDLSQQAATQHEAQAVGGDSGGAVFARGSEGWELAGIMVSTTQYEGQPEQTVLYGNETWSVQLADYSDQIRSIMTETAPACDDGMDDDGDGRTDYPDDPGCDDPLDPFETSETLPCDDGIDNDGDGRVDFDLATYVHLGNETTPPDGEGDPGCVDPTWGTESPRCQDGIDNDGDGTMDYDAGLSANGSADPGGLDPQCAGRPWLDSEASSPGCGLGAELALLLPPLLWMRRRQR